MEKFTAKIKDEIGLHARPASVMVSVASKFKSNITISSNGKEGNVKSIMNIMSLGIKHNDEVTIIANGEDEKQAISEIEKTMKENGVI